MRISDWSSDVCSSDLLAFAAIGFAAQIVDGALGMAFGVISNTLLLSLGVPPAAASAGVHAVETFTTAVSGISHAIHRNIDWRLFFRLLIPRSDEHTSELQSLMRISYAVFCLTKKN